MDCFQKVNSPKNGQSPREARKLVVKHTFLELEARNSSPVGLRVRASSDPALYEGSLFEASNNERTDSNEMQLEEEIEPDIVLVGLDDDIESSGGAAETESTATFCEQTPQQTPRSSGGETSEAVESRSQPQLQFTSNQQPQSSGVSCDSDGSEVGAEDLASENARLRAQNMFLRQHCLDVAMKTKGNVSAAIEAASSPAEEAVQGQSADLTAKNLQDEMAMMQAAYAAQRHQDVSQSGACGALVGAEMVGQRVQDVSQNGDAPHTGMLPSSGPPGAFFPQNFVWVPMPVMAMDSGRQETLSMPPGNLLPPQATDAAFAPCNTMKRQAQGGPRAKRGARVARAQQMFVKHAAAAGTAPSIVRATSGAMQAGLPRAAQSSASAVDIFDEADGGNAPCTLPPHLRTTVMLRNLPNNYSRAMLLDLLDSEGFSKLYDFIYLPIDFKSRASLGYSFVNLVNPEAANRFRLTFEGFSNWILPSRKVCYVTWSGPHQGLREHVERYRNSPVMHDTVPDTYKPVIFKDGVRAAFPPPSKKLRAPRIRHFRAGNGTDFRNDSTCVGLRPERNADVTLSGSKPAAAASQLHSACLPEALKLQQMNNCDGYWSGDEHFWM